MAKFCLSSIKLAGPNQQNQIEIFSTYFVLNYIINDNFVLCAISKKIGATNLILSWQNQFKIKEKEKNTSYIEQIRKLLKKRIREHGNHINRNTSQLSIGHKEKKNVNAV